MPDVTPPTVAPEAAVAAVMEAMGKHRLIPRWGRRKTDDPERWEFPCSCGEVLRNGGPAFDLHIADAAVDAARPSIQPQAVRDLAAELDSATQSWNRNEGVSIVPDPWGDPGSRVALPDWLRARADRIEGDHG